MAKQLFGTDGIRGIPGNFPWTTPRFIALGTRSGRLSFAVPKPKPRVLIGMDTRESGPHIAGEIAAGLAATA